MTRLPGRRSLLRDTPSRPTCVQSAVMTDVADSSPGASSPRSLLLLLLPLVLLGLASLSCAGCGSTAPEGELGAREEEAAPAAEELPAVDRRDDPAEPDRWFRELRRVEGGAVTVLVPEGPAAGPPTGNEADAAPGRSAETSRGSGGETAVREGTYRLGADAFVPRRLAAELSTAVEAMAPRLPLDPASLRRDPLTVAVEATYPQQILHTGDVGEAVVGGPADVHLVFHPEDGFAYRHALARALLRRAGLGRELPPYLRLGAAWWLVDGATASHWYGRPRTDWLSRLAAAEVLPTVDELLAAEEPPDGSRLLWTPLAAAVVDSLPGDTLAEKLAHAGEDEIRNRTDRLLADLARSAAGEARPGNGAPPGQVARSGTPTPSRPPQPGDGLPPFLAGVSLAMLNHVHLGYHAPSVDAALANLHRSVAANAVSLMPFAYQRRPDDPALVYLNRRPRSETDVAMIHAGRRADERGFTVLWKPQIWLSGSWPGEVAMDSEAEWDRWFRSYRRFLAHQAVLADRVGAEMFSVGVELGRTVERTRDWHRLIDAVEVFYGGPLTYSANWHGDFDRVSFWDRLDFLGMDAYEPLTGDPEATDADLAAGARRVVAKLAQGARQHRKPLILTEVGFAAHEAAWVAPHEEGGPLSPEDQARAYRALLGALETGDGPPAWLKGLFVWKAFSSGPRLPGGQERGEGGDDFADFRFLGRPAQEMIRDHYARSVQDPPG